MRLASCVASPKLSLAPGIGGLLDVFSIASDLYSIRTDLFLVRQWSNSCLTDIEQLSDTGQIAMRQLSDKLFYRRELKTESL